ncbi:MAG TPA: sulfatase, partial [Thermoanaerobaculia bacterium]|nr:sulfatase [Thermoanaerobaculia bacterium]
MRRALIVCVLFALACREKPAAEAARPSILLVTLDTTRADAMGANTPAFEALAARGQRFTSAYATVPQTLPSHASMMTGLYPAGHGVHENARFLSESHPLLAEKLKGAGYATAAFVSAFAVARRFGLGRGFDVYDEDFGAGLAERNAKATTDRAIAHLQSASGPQFLWVHYYDPHFPYLHGGYAGEVAFMDQQLGRLVQAFEQRAPGPHGIIVVADHGEGLGDHGEDQHGNLLYQSTMHVPFVIVGPGVVPGTNATPVSTRRVFHTVMRWA